MTDTIIYSSQIQQKSSIATIVKMEEAIMKVDNFMRQYPSLTQYGKRVVACISTRAQKRYKAFIILVVLFHQIILTIYPTYK